MYSKKILILCFLLLFGIVGHSFAKDGKPVILTGKVVDYEGRPCPQVKVRLYERSNDVTSDSYDLKLIKRTTTEAAGLFSFVITPRDNALVYGYVVAEVESLAPGWEFWDMKEDEKCEIKLRKAGELSGYVVDENDRPVEQAEVSFYTMRMIDGDKRRHFSGPLISMLFHTNTDDPGRFKFTNMPVDTKTDFLVRKAGRATITTYINSSSLHYSTGDSDIKLVQPVEARIEGTCVEKKSGEPVAGQVLGLVGERNQPLAGHERIVSKEDGTFSIDGLAAGKCFLQLVTPRQGLAEWAAERTELMNEAGKTLSDLKIELSKGGILEVKVNDNRDKKPLENAGVSVQEQQSNRNFHIRTVGDGIARIRLIPGRYRISNVYMQGYTSNRGSREMITIEAGKTKRLEYELAVNPKITGVVRDDKGRPLEGVQLKIWPFGMGEFISNAEGQFEINWDPQFLHVGVDASYSLIGRHEERNLSINAPIDTETRTMDIKLRPGVLFTGKVVDTDGKAIAGAKLTVMMRALNLGTAMRHEPYRTDSDGNFEIRAVPDGIKYSISVAADDYGRKYKDIDINQAENGKLDLGIMTLSPANLTVSGVVVDENDKPLANVKVESRSPNQPYNIAQTDKDGKFELKVSQGRLTVRATSTGSPKLFGSVATEGGAADIKIIVSEGSSVSSRYVPRRPASLTGKKLPEIKNLNAGISKADTENKVVLLCFFDMNQRPSRNCIVQLSKQAKRLEEKGVVIVAVQASKVTKDTLDKWIKENKIPFPAGMIKGDVEKIRFAWGVKSLPWLILRDSGHIVCSEGFNVNELEEYIAKLGEKR